MSRTVIVALLAGRPLCAAMIVWKLVSPSPGMLVWTSSTSGSAMTISSAAIATSRTDSDEAPVGGAMLTWTSFSPPGSMNWVGSSGTSASEAKNRTPARATMPSAVQRVFRTNVMIGV